MMERTGSLHGRPVEFQPHPSREEHAVNESASVPNVDAAEAAVLTDAGAVVRLDPVAVARDRLIITVCRSGNRSGKVT